MVAPLFVFFGWLSDRVGRKPVMLVGYGLSLLLLFPSFHLLANSANPQLIEAMRVAPVTISGPNCDFNPFASKQASPCGNALQFFSGRGIGTKIVEGGDALTVQIGDTTVAGFDKKSYEAAVVSAGYPAKPYDGPRDRGGIIAAILMLGVLSATTYGRGGSDHGRTVPGAHPLHVDVDPLSYRDRLFRRLPAADLAVHRRQERQIHMADYGTPGLSWRWRSSSPGYGCRKTRGRDVAS